MILSDVDIRKAISDGRIGIEPFDEVDIQPSSVDLHVDRLFRTFNNHRHSFIDVKQPMEELTELVEVSEGESFILHPGEFVLGSTTEYVRLPDDLVARLEGKSSLGRLGLLIHSSLPADETVLFRHGGQVRQVPIGEIVGKRLEGSVVSFDPETFQVSWHPVTGWHETAPDRIFEVRLASGRRVRLTGAHSLFTVQPSGDVAKVRVRELAAGTRVAIPRNIPDPGEDTDIRVIDLMPELEWDRFVCGGPVVADAFARSRRDVAAALTDLGIQHIGYYERRGVLPVRAAMQISGLRESLGSDDWFGVKGGVHRVPAVLHIDRETAWMLGLYVAEGSRRRRGFTISNTDQAILDRAADALARWNLGVHRSQGAVTCCSVVMSAVIGWLGSGGYAREKRIPDPVLGWPSYLIESFLEGFVAGDGSIEATRTSLWTSSDALVGDLMLICTRLGKRSSASSRTRPTGVMWQVSVPHREHKLLTTVPDCGELLVNLRMGCGLSQKEAADLAGFKHSTQLNNIERSGRPIRRSTVTTLVGAYADHAPSGLPKLRRLAEGELLWDKVAEVIDTGTSEPVFDLEVRPEGRRIENFLAGAGGVFVSNTAGYVDPGFEGHLTLELSNVANLPITIYPGMKIGQISFFRLTSAAENPYGSKAVGSKYQGQRGPTPSRYFENFR